MYHNNKLSAKPTKGCCTPEESASHYQNGAKKINPASKFRKTINFILVAFFLTSLITPASAQLDMIFGTNNTQKVAGNSNGLNAKYLYTNVSSGIDCIVTVVEVSGGAKLFNFDDNSGTYDGEIFRFQPIITAPNSSNNTSYIRFRFQLIQGGSYVNGTGVGTNILPTEPIWFRAYDVDGNGNGGGVSEFVELNNSFTGSWVDAPTNLVAKTPTITSGGKSYRNADPTINGDNISDEGKFAFNGFIYAQSAGSWEIMGGSIVGANPPDPTGTFSDADRLNSWSFRHSDAIPGIDFGDAPSTYSGSSPVLPAYHLVPSIPSNIKVYLGSVKPDPDYDPSGNAAADVDDKNDAIDDEDALPYRYFPKWSGSGAYTCQVTATNTSGSNAFLYGYIDFNGNGVFDAAEKSTAVTIPSNSGALQTVTVTFPTGFTYNVSATVNRYARFRIASSTTESGAANGSAADGEVEDFRFNVAVNVSGTVYNDVNGKTDGLINGTAIAQPSSVQLYATLVDSNNIVVETVAVNNSSAVGTYSFTKAGTNSTFTVVLSTNAGVIGSAPPAIALPTGWVNTAEGTTNPGDATANGSFNLVVPTAPSDITGLNFGIEQRPNAVDKTLTAVGNPGGFNFYNYPSGSFAPVDYSGGSVSTIAIATFPANANALKIGGVTYTNGGTCPTGSSCTAWPSGGVSGIAFNSGDPNVEVDPIDGNVTVAIDYSATDNAGFQSLNTGKVSIDFKVISVAGNVWNDVNGNGVNSSETLYTGTGLYAVLVDAAGKILQSAAVTSGNYSLTNVPYNTTGSSVILSTSAGTVGATLATASVVTNYVITGENNNGTVELPGNGIIILPATTTSLTARNFGIEQPPVAVNKTLTAVGNPGGFNFYTYTTGSFVPTDADGTVSTISIANFPSKANAVTINSVTYTNGGTCPTGSSCTAWPSGGVSGIPYNSGNPAISVDPIDGNVTVGIIYKATDNAGKTSANSGTVNIDFKVLTVSGNVWNDVNGNAVNNSETLYTISGLYAILVDAAGKVVQSAAVVSGSYTLTGLPYSTANYKVVISSVAGVVGDDAPDFSVPNLYTVTGENNSGTVELPGDGTIILPSTSTSLTARNFGIEQPPVANDKTLASQGNPGGFTFYAIPSASFTPTDADGTVSSISIGSFPNNVNALKIGSITYTNGGTCPTGSCTAWPNGGVSNIPYNSGAPAVSIDPIDGNVNVDIKYTAKDNAGFESFNAGTVSVPFKSVTVTGNVWNDKNGDAIKNTGEIVYAGNALSATLVDNTGKVVQTVPVTSTGTYTITDLPYNVTGYKVIISTATGITYGASAPGAAAPNTYVMTGKNIAGTVDKTFDGSITLPATTVALVNRDFGIERLPESYDRNLTLGAATVGYSTNMGTAFGGSDPEDSPAASSINAGGTFIITRLMGADTAVLVYNGSVVTLGQKITYYDPSMLKIKYTKLVSKVTFNYATVDAAGMQDPTPALYTVNLVTLLPLNGVVLSANLQGSLVNLKWDVSTETSVVRYQLERGTDGANFTTVATVAYRATTSTTNAYAQTDVPNVTTGTLYYRVIQYKADGSRIISNQVVVRLNDKATQQVKVFPTLISDIANISIRTTAAQKVSVNVVDNNGRLVIKNESSVAAGSTTFPIDGWARLANGSYYIQVTGTDIKQVVKVIVQH